MPIAKLEARYPLSPMQQGMFLHSLNEHGVYIQQLMCTLNETVDAPKFAKAWQAVLQRHSILRTSFRWEDLEEPIQEVYGGIQCPFRNEDWRALNPERQQQELDAFIKTDREAGFILSVAPLMRVALFRLGDRDYRAIWTFHHALLDGRSHFLVLKEVFDLYAAFCRGEQIELKQPRPFSDYIEWLSKQDACAQEMFWRQSLGGFRTPTQLGEAREQSAERSVRHASEEIEISAEVTSRLRSLAQENEVTLNNFLQAAWALLINRYTGDEDVVFGATRACRYWTAEDAKSIIGLFINTLPLRVLVQPEQSLASFLKELRARHVALREYEHTPLRKIQEWSEVPRGKPLFESVLVFEEYQMNSRFKALGDGWNSRNFKLLEKTNYPLLVAAYAGSEITLKIEYEETTFDQSTIKRMLVQMKSLLDAMSAGLEQRLSELSMLDRAERQKLLVEWNQVKAVTTGGRCVHELFEAQVERTPDAVAIVYENQRLTYEELNAKANQLAHYLRSMGVGPEVLVGLYIERSLEMVIGILGILKAGGAYVPLDPAYPKDRLQFMIQDSQLKVLLTNQSLEKETPLDAHTVCLDRDWLLISKESTENPVSGATADNLIYVIYTSGSTGKPKGVLITHRNVSRLLEATDHWFGFTERDVWTLFHSHAFDFSVWEVWGALAYGGRLVVVSYVVSRSPRDFYELLAKEGVTVLNQTPSAFRQLIQAEESMAAPLQLALRYVIFGGEALDFHSLQPWLQRHGDSSPQLINMYGITETTVHVTYYPLTTEIVSGASGSVIGERIPDLQVYILDQNLQPVPIGTPGELHVGGGGVARGYLNRPELTVQKFIRNVFSDNPEARLYRTGDLARYLPDGNIEYLGRIDNQVKIRGFRIELGEIESLLSQFPGVRETVVVAREDESGSKRLVAYVVTTPQAKAGIEEMRNFLKQKLPAYMIPSAFVKMDSLPLTANGKIDRRALPEPDTSRSELAEVFVPHRDSLEQQLREIWEDVLRVQPVGIKDNFFSLGGHSLLAVRMFAQIEKKLKRKLSIATLFQAPTIEELAGVLRQEAETAAWSSLVAIQPEGSKPPFFCIHARGGNVLFYRDLARHLGIDQPVYGLQARGLDGKQPYDTRIEDMATYYIKEMKTLQPEGPYYVAGSSFGGMVAFEIAQQLRTCGEKVGILALFDTAGPDYPKFKPVTTFTSYRNRLQTIARRIDHTQRVLRNLESGHRMEYVRQKARKAKVKYIRASRRKLMKIGSKLPSSMARSLLPSYVNARWALLELEKALGQAVAAYVHEIYPGKLTLFRASKQPVGIYENPTLGWETVVSGGIDLYEVPGYHGTIVAEPNVRLLAERLRICLAKAYADSEAEELQETEGEPELAYKLSA